MPNKMLNSRRVLVASFVGFLVLVYLLNTSSPDNSAAGRHHKADFMSNIYDEFENSYMISRHYQDRLTECGPDTADQKDDDFDWKPVLDFENFNPKDSSSSSSSSAKVVPNLVHLIFTTKTATTSNSTIAEFSYDQMIVLFSIFLNQNPRKILLHCDGEDEIECDSYFKGPHWDKVKSIKCLRKRVVIRKIPRLTSDNQLTSAVERRERLKWTILMSYGGIYLGYGVFLVNSLDKYRAFEMTFAHPLESPRRANVILASPQARFLQSYLVESFGLDCIKLDSDDFSKQTNEFLKKHPQSVHLVDRSKLNSNDERDEQQMMVNLYKSRWSGWKKMDTIDLMLTARSGQINDQTWSSSSSSSSSSITKNERTTIDEMYLDVLKRIKPFESSSSSSSSLETMKNF